MTLAPIIRRPRKKNPVTLSLTAAEFSAGIGLVRLALQNLGGRVLWANDSDPDKAQMYHANFGTADLHVGDVHLVPAADIPPCTLYTACFPGNDLSIAGAMASRNGKEKDSVHEHLLGRRGRWNLLI